ncbi:hypothetical protein CPB86DRAFT_809963 [Serendipita vermifera]|nr:hypothetical protein CPB86DRAFT_809963 [Serendipita vermifera]
MWNGYPGNQPQQGWGSAPQGGGFGFPAAPGQSPYPPQQQQQAQPGFFNPPSGAPPYGGSGYPGSNVPSHNATPGYPGASASNANANTFSWNPRMGPPPSGPPPTNHYNQYTPPFTHAAPSHYANMPPPNVNGYQGAPGGNWVGDQSGGAFYSAPMGAPHMPPTTPQYGPQSGGGQGQGQQYQYSQCTGRKKALCIGINYAGTDAALRGCINDAKNMKQFLIRRFGFRAEDIVMLLDDATHPRQIPTRANIIAAMQWLVKGAQSNDSLWFHFSGHGGQTKDLDGDEDDGYDEVIYPVDHETAGHLVDDDMHDIMVKNLPIGCRLTAIFDSCHSGSVMDLPYIYSTEGKIKEPNQAVEAGKGALQAISAYSKGDMGGVLKAGIGIFKVATGSPNNAIKKARETKSSEADVISWSGCKDSQTSADATEAGKATGAMSYAFITSMDAQPNQTYQQLLVSIREILRTKYSQKPQLSASHPMDTSILFIA